MLLQPSELAAFEARTAGRLLRRSESAAHTSAWMGASSVPVPGYPGKDQALKLMAGDEILPVYRVHSAGYACFSSSTRSTVVSTSPGQK
eukprot:404756-Rhodomonas_salina.1